MRATLAIVADDLTGAADAGAGFCRAGLVTVVTWAEDPFDARLLDGADVVAIDARTRDADATRAYSITHKIVSALRDHGIGELYKKIDSTLRGHPGAEVSACLDAWHTDAVAIVAPAFPDTGRTTVGGRQRIDGVPIQEPAVDALLVSRGVSTSHLDLHCVRQGALADAIRESCARGMRAIVCDAETNDDLRAIVFAGGRLPRHVIWTGTGGLAAALADTRRSGPARPAPSLVEGPASFDLPTARGPILVVVGSASDIARAQAARVVASGVTFPAGALDGANHDAGRRLADQVSQHLRAQRDVLITIESDAAVSTNDSRLMMTLGELLEHCAESIGALVVTGGATATALLRRWNTIGLRLCGELEPGVPVSMTVGAWTIPVVTKAGSFGQVETLERARTALVQHSTRPT
jgi:D-threonate/D-erythronate kinase